MSLLAHITPSPRKVMNLFYVVDTSLSMSGSRIGTLNAAMEESIPFLNEIAEENDDADIKVSILQFSSGCNWVTPESGPVPLDELEWTDLQAEGITDFGAALLELDNKLSRKAFLKSQTGAYAPVIILISDGGPTDNWEKGLNQLRQNNWFKHAIKIAIDIESGAERSVLESFTGTPEAILEAKDTAILKKMIHKVSVRASEFQSHSKQADETISSPEEDSGNIVRDVISDIKDESDAEDDSEWGAWQ